MTRRQLLRLIAYGFVGILLVFLLLIYSLYLSAQRPPAFYKESLEIAHEILETRSLAMVEKSRELDVAVKKVDKPWETTFSDGELNGYFAVEATKPGAKILPNDVHDLRVRITPNQIDLACGIERGPLAGILHLTLGITLPEPNTLKIRIRNARIGRLPISKELAGNVMVEALEKQGRTVIRAHEEGDPTLTIPLDLKYGKDQRINLNELRLDDRTLRISGETMREKK